MGQLSELTGVTSETLEKSKATTCRAKDKPRIYGYVTLGEQVWLGNTARACGDAVGFTHDL